jgi:rhodanese-related sulfurtransferase
MKLAKLVLFVLILSTSLLRAADPAVKNLDVDAFAKMREAKTNVVLDVRTKQEYDAGHMPGAILIDFNSPDFASKIAALSKDKTYLVHCAAGGRSAKACDKMGKLNFLSVYNLEGGFRAWEKAGKPVEK